MGERVSFCRIFGSVAELRSGCIRLGRGEIRFYFAPLVLGPAMPVMKTTPGFTLERSDDDDGLSYRRELQRIAWEAIMRHEQ